MSNNLNIGRYELPEELKDILDATAILHKRLDSFCNHERETLKQSDFNDFYMGKILEPLEEANDNVSEVFGALLEYAKNIIRNQCYAHIDEQTDV